MTSVGFSRTNVLVLFAPVLAACFQLTVSFTVFWNEPVWTHLALHLPGFGDSWQVTTCHHHGPGGETYRDSQHPARDADDYQSSAASQTCFQVSIKYNLSNSCVTYMTISFRMGLLETNSVASFSSVIGSVAFTMFWNMVLFLRDDKQVRRRRTSQSHQTN